ncbi:TetR/AcrR family transcriptional regulator [Brochothrix campestris]|uniref:Transcriptional regulator n=1 Tax=Brochothrix campestris FSL F6-1037 TaxID=1265861 RepID=W7CKD0_9LIST|nr:TetR/AcrR family transcriptional regulator [Brochothrix campestris]EUJ36281.1 transcriptional regulator [Brochothrix campestris FSL F6-1037]
MNLRKTQITNAARDLFIEKGFTDTSMADIIAAAKISKGTFYNHFSSKSECLIAILEESRVEASLLRHELAIGTAANDMEVLAKQIGVVIRLNRKNNLIRIFESINHSNDKEIQRMLNLHHLSEVDWLAARIVEVYGPAIIPASYEAAVLTYGMIHHVLKLVVSSGFKPAHPENIVKNALKHLEAIIPQLIGSQTLTISDDLLENIRCSIHYQAVTRVSLIEEFKLFIAALPATTPLEGLEYATFLNEQIASETPKKHLIQTVLPAFHQAFAQTDCSTAAKMLAMHVWQYLKAD